MDTWMGFENDPVTLHKYLYAGNDPIRNVDYSGNNFTLTGIGASLSIQSKLALTTVAFVGGFILGDFYVSEYNPAHITHEYEYDTEICSTSESWCTKEKVFQGLLIYPAPGTSNVGPVSNNEQNNVCLFGYFCQPIIHNVSSTTFKVTNITLPGHVFWKGQVERYVDRKNGELVIVSKGTGYNTSLGRFLFNHAGAHAFNLSDWNIKHYVEESR